MIRAINTPAANIKLSRQDTFDILNDTNEQKRRSAMVTKWKAKVSDADERSSIDILELFGLDSYQYNRFIAHDRHLHSPETAKTLVELS